MSYPSIYPSDVVPSKHAYAGYPYGECNQDPHGSHITAHQEKRNYINIFILTYFLLYNAALAFTVADTFEEVQALPYIYRLT